jgi:hypothetical protein
MVIALATSTPTPLYQNVREGHGQTQFNYRGSFQDVKRTELALGENMNLNAH